MCFYFRVASFAVVNCMLLGICLEVELLGFIWSSFNGWLKYNY